MLKFPANFDPETFRIVFHPFFRVAILLFSIELAKSGRTSNQSDLGDFIQMNYLLRFYLPGR
jgi:hypothetical protein